MYFVYFLSIKLIIFQITLVIDFYSRFYQIFFKIILSIVSGNTHVISCNTQVMISDSNTYFSVSLSFLLPVYPGRMVWTWTWLERFIYLR